MNTINALVRKEKVRAVVMALDRLRPLGVVHRTALSGFAPGGTQPATGQSSAESPALASVEVLCPEGLEYEVNGTIEIATSGDEPADGFIAVTEVIRPVLLDDRAADGSTVDLDRPTRRDDDLPPLAA